MKERDHSNVNIVTIPALKRTAWIDISASYHEEKMSLKSEFCNYMYISASFGGLNTIPVLLKATVTIQKLCLAVRLFH